jgi:CheY-like chemotaxis protein
MRRSTVLIVEGDPDVRRRYRVALRFAGFEVRESRDGLSALQELEHPPLPDCIVLDLMLPVMSGHEVKQELAASADRRHIPVVILTGSQEPVGHLDPACVLKTPVSGDNVVAAVERCLERRASR